MKTLKGLVFCVSFLLMSSYCLQSSEIFTKSLLQRSLRRNLCTISCWLFDLPYRGNNFAATRGYSSFSDKGDDQGPMQGCPFLGAVHNLSSGSAAWRDKEAQLKRYEALFKRFELLLQEIEGNRDSIRQLPDNRHGYNSAHLLGHGGIQQRIMQPDDSQFHQKNLHSASKAVNSSGYPSMEVSVPKPKHPKLDRKPAIITAVNPKDSVVPSAHLPGSGAETDSPSPRTQKYALEYQVSSETVGKMQDDLVNRIMSAARTTHNISPQDVRSVLDLYANQAFTPQSDPNTLGTLTPQNRLTDRDCETNLALAGQNVNTASTELHTGNFFDNFLQTKDGKYRISTEEQKRLNRIYGLLPEYHAKSITSLLSGATINKKLPIWNAVQDAIDQIRQDALRAGDLTTIDLNYFRKLHWASVRVTGKSGSGEKSLPEDNTARLSMKSGSSESMLLSKKKEQPLKKARISIKKK